MSATEAQQIAELEKQIAELEAFKAACKCQKGGKPQQKKKKKNKVCKSDLVVRLTPGDDCDWKAVEAAVRAIEIDGLMWATVFTLDDLVFGLKALSVGAQIEDLMVPETAPVVEQLGKIPGVAQAELLNIQTAQADWGGVSSGKQPKKKKNKKKKEEVKLEITQKEIEAAASQFSMLARDAEVYAAGVPAMDRSGGMDVTEAQLRAVAELISQKKPKLIFLLIAAGKTTCSVLGCIPSEHKDKPGSDAVAMVKSTFLDDVTATGDKNSAYAELVCDAAKNQFAIKEKDNCLTQFFKYLNVSGLAPDDSDSEDECVLSSDEE